MIYLLEDDEDIRELVIYMLQNQGMQAEGFATPSLFWSAMKHNKPELLLLDVMLPEEDGISILKKLRSSSSTQKLPVIMLTAKGSEYDTILGLDCGADDYIPKPFRMMELLSRIHAVLRRAAEQAVAVEYCFKALYVCPSRHIVTVDGESISLTLKEFELLSLLLAERGTVLTRTQLLDKIWGYRFAGESRTVDVHIRTLRQKLGTAGNYIETVRGMGYKIGGTQP